VSETLMGADEYILGVDGGNTKTIALIARRDGTVVGVGRAGCSDLYTNPMAAVPLAEIEQAVAQACAQAGIDAATLAVGGFSLAGADWPEDYTFLQTVLAQRGLARRVIVVNDAVGALWAGAPTGPAVGVACGTGAAIAARAADGRVWHTSWWQESLGAHQLGTRTLRAVYRAELGIDPPTALTAAVLRHFEQETVEGVLHLFTAYGGQPPPQARVALLARVLLDAAQAGDPVAQRIAEAQGTALGDYALAAARRVGIEHAPFTLVLTGGVLRHPEPLLPAALIARVRQAAPAANPLYSPFEPVVGALFLALDAIDQPITDALCARLRATLPESTVFAT
jgi:N-acetylglucosamine kinase-like BadF-type ATPase